MRAAILNPSGGIRLAELPTPSPGPGEALIRVLVCGVCTSDMGVYRSGLGNDAVLGHEVVGVVEALGEGATGIDIGQRVTGAIMRGYADCAVARADCAIPVPDTLLDHEAITEPFSCMMSGIRRAGCAGAESAVVVGAGFMGLSLISLLKAAGVRHVGVCDVSPAALERAQSFGADAVYLPFAKPPECAFVFEAAGTQGALTLAGELVSREGTLTVVGYHPCRRDIDMNLWASKAITVINAFEYNRQRQLANMREALEIIAHGELPLGKLFTHRFPLEHAEQAFQTHLQRPDGFIKGYIRVSNQ